MANTVIQLKHSTLTGNVPSSLANGEISINSRDGKFFYSTPAGVVVTHYPYPGPAGLNQEIQFNDSGVLGSDSGLTYNKTTDVLTVVGGAIVGGVNVTPQIQLAFTQANTPSHVANSAASYANSAFGRANNSINANTGGTITGNLTISGNLTMTGAGNISVANISITNNLSAVTAALTVNSITTGTGTGGTIAGANTIYANTFVANTGGFIQFADGSKQYTANAGSGGSDTSAGLYANSGFAVANSSASYANAAFAQANTSSGAAAASSYANSAFAQANTAQSTASSAAGTASAAQSAAGTAQSTADSAAIYANGAFAQANTGGASFGDYFPTEDYGTLTDANISVFGETLLVTYDCRIDPITPNGYFLTKDLGYLT